MVQANDVDIPSVKPPRRNPVLKSMQDLDDAKREKFVSNLIANGANVGGNELPFCQPQEIPWFDEEIYETGRRFAKDYIVLNLILNVMEFVGTGMARPTIPLLLRSGNYYPKHLWLRRAITTIKNFNIGYLDDLRDPNSEGIKRLRFGRKMHELYRDVKPGSNLLPLGDEEIPQKYHKLAALLRNSSAHLDTTGAAGEDVITWRPPLLFSQLDVMLATMGMILPFYLAPEIAGKVPEDGARAYIYIWALYGRLMGLRDEFNLALRPDKKLYHQILRRILGPMLQRIDGTGAMFLSQAAEESRVIFGYMISSRTLLYSGLKFYVEDGKDLFWSSLNFLEKSQATLLGIMFSLYLNVSLFRYFVNYVGWGYWKLLAKLVEVQPKEREDNKMTVNRLREACVKE